MGFFSEIKTRHRVKHGYMFWVALQAWALRHIETSGRESSRSSPLERSGAACSQNVTPQMRLPSPSPAHAEGFQSYTHVEKKGSESRQSIRSNGFTTYPKKTEWRKRSKVSEKVIFICFNQFELKQDIFSAVDVRYRLGQMGHLVYPQQHGIVMLIQICTLRSQTHQVF